MVRYSTKNQRSNDENTYFISYYAVNFAKLQKAHIIGLWFNELQRNTL